MKDSITDVPGILVGHAQDIAPARAARSSFAAGTARVPV